MAVVLFSVRVAYAQGAGGAAPPQEGEPPPPQEGAPPPQEGEAPQEGEPHPQPPPDEIAVPDQEGAVPEQEGQVPLQEGEAAPPEPAPPAPVPVTPPPLTPESEPAPSPVEVPPEPPPDLKVVVKEEQPAAPAPEEPVVKPRDCKSRWGCWDLLHTSKDTVLGGRASLGYAAHPHDDALTAGFMALYLTEHFATHDYMAVHFAGTGGLGRGLAATEGIVALNLDFGFRANVSEVSGPFVRVGVNGFLMGHSEFHVGVLEPFQGRAGYQYLRGDVLVEAGLTQGFVPIARYGVTDGRLDLSRTTELGAYTALRLPPYRANVSFMELLPGTGQGHQTLLITRALVCNNQLAVTLCADVLYTRGQVEEHDRHVLGQAVQGGVTIGLSP